MTQQQEAQVTAFTSQLAESGSAYLCTTALPDTIARVRFLGRFQDRAVVWDATIYTLSRYYQTFDAERAASERISSARSFFEIAPAVDGGYPLLMALNLPVIDVPTIKKTIVMIRNYKRLRMGKVEWGA